MERRRILIVDSELDFVGAAKEALEDFCEVRVAFSKERGVEAATEGHPDLIIIGFLEPRGDSLKLHRQLRAESATRDIPLLVVDVRSEDHARKGWKVEEGMDAEGYLIRPVEPAELREEVIRVLESIASKPLETREALEQMEMLLKRVERIWRCP